MTNDKRMADEAYEQHRKRKPVEDTTDPRIAISIG